MNNCIFCKIASGEIPKELRFQDDNIVGFDDINPVRPIHVLFVPKKHIEDFNDLLDAGILDSVRKGVQKLVLETKLMGKGYKVLVNGGGAQVVNHLHLHLIGPIGLKAEI